jgi:hypothetical protein
VSGKKQNSTNGKTVWEIEQLERRKAYDALSAGQKQSIHDFLVTFVSVRKCVVGLMPLNYEDLCNLESAWWRMRGSFGLDLDPYNPEIDRD